MNSILCILFNVSVYCIVLHIMYNSDVFVVWWVHGASLVCVYRVGAWGGCSTRVSLVHVQMTNKVLTYLLTYGASPPSA